MASSEAEAFFAAMAKAPQQISLPLAARRVAGEHAEDATAEPVGVRVEGAPEVGGFWVVPDGAAPERAILYLFGGGYVLGSPASRRKTAGHLARAAGARVLVPSYRLAPEHPFPAAVEDALAALAAVARAGVPPSRTAIVGDSAGGGLAVATAIAAGDKGLPLPAAVATFSMWGDLTLSGASMDAKAAVDIECTRSGLAEMAGWYLAGADPRHPWASPVLADVGGLPPLLLLVGSNEVLLDDSVRMARAAALAGGDATLHVVSGMQHVFPIWVGAFPEAGEAVAGVGAFVRRHT